MRTEMRVLCEEMKVGVKVKAGTKKPNTWTDRPMIGYTVTLKFKGRQLTVPFWVGEGWGSKQPDAADVLYCLVSDATGVADRSFPEWASDMGYDEDSIKALETYRECKKIDKKVRKLLGDAFDTFSTAEH